MVWLTFTNKGNYIQALAYWTSANSNQRRLNQTYARRSQVHSLTGHGLWEATTNISGSLLAPARNDDVCSQHSQPLGRLVSDPSVASRYNGHSTALVDLRVRQTSTHSHRSHTQHSRRTQRIWPYIWSIIWLRTVYIFLHSSPLPFIASSQLPRYDVQVTTGRTVPYAPVHTIIHVAPHNISWHPRQVIYKSRKARMGNETKRNGGPNKMAAGVRLRRGWSPDARSSVSSVSH